MSHSVLRATERAGFGHGQTGSAMGMGLAIRVTSEPQVIYQDTTRRRNRSVFTGAKLDKPERRRRDRCRIWK